GGCRPLLFGQRNRRSQVAERNRARNASNELGGRAAHQSSPVGWANATQSVGALVFADLFLYQHGSLRSWVLAPPNHQEHRRQERARHRAFGRYPVRLRGRRDDIGWQKLGSHRRTTMAL